MVNRLSNIFISNWRDATGWYDFEIPEGYVPGSALTLNVDIEFSGSDGVTIPMWAYGVTANGGAITDIPLANDQGTLATMEVGTELALFCAETEPVQNVPHTRQTISFPINPVNRNAEGWSHLFGDSTPDIGLNGGAVVIEGSLVPPPFSGDPGSGWIRVFSVDGNPIYDVAGWPCGIIPGPVTGGTGASMGPTEGSISLGPGDVVSIVFWIWPAASFFTLGSILIHAMSMDCGAGGIQDFDLTQTSVVSSFDDPSHASRPVPVSLTAGNVGGNYTWILNTIPDPPVGHPTSQGQIF